MEVPIKAHVYILLLYLFYAVWLKTTAYYLQFKNITCFNNLDNTMFINLLFPHMLYYSLLHVHLLLSVLYIFYVYSNHDGIAFFYHAVLICCYYFIILFTIFKCNFQSFIMICFLLQ